MKINNVTFSNYGRLVLNDRKESTIAGETNKIYYINDGSMIYKSGDVEHTLKTGFLYIIPQNCVATFEIDYVDNTLVEFRCEPEIIMNDILEIELKKYPLIESVVNTLNHLVSRYPMWEMSPEFKYHELIKSTFMNLFVLIDEDFTISTITDEAISKAISYIHENFNKKITIKEIADNLHIAECCFIRRFKKYINTTPYQYIKSLRINKAVEYIKSDRYTLGEIAEMVGYSDATSLSHSVTGLQLSEK